MLSCFCNELQLYKHVRHDLFTNSINSIIIIYNYDLLQNNVS